MSDKDDTINITPIRPGIKVQSSDTKEPVVPPNKHIVECLKELLEEAEKGHLQSIVITGVRTDNTPINAIIGYITIELIGLTTILKSKLW